DTFPDSHLHLLLPIVILGVILHPPPPLRTDLVVLTEPAQRLFGDPLRHAFDGVIRRRYRHTERFAAAHVGQEAVERAHLGEHRLSPDEALPLHVESVAHGPPQAVLATLHRIC